MLLWYVHMCVYVCNYKYTCIFFFCVYVCEYKVLCTEDYLYFWLFAPNIDAYFFSVCMFVKIRCFVLKIICIFGVST